MKKFWLFIFHLALVASFDANVSDKINWKGLAEINHHTLAIKSGDYIRSTFPELENVEIKLIKVNASYSFQHQHSNLNVMFMHSDSLVDGSSHKRTVYVDDKAQEIEMNMIHYIFLDFNENGEAINHRVEEVPFHGSQKDFEKEFQKL
ncbi:hypothetical protein CWC17_10555 [Pseudoalteromonas sp. S3785]|uniref:hypothetical protein n=1 Tax=Pseudoalteromonas sp. S3785 TaxID=579545 RepID=UPI00110AABA3|nr:hypothetical protein [Pseudoalteromonas sp. S3785]TMO73548.1 hypothetical protein CWC17_10555 [Pseudoalteromonas sp. S3785]